MMSVHGVIWYKFGNAHDNRTRNAMKTNCHVGFTMLILSVASWPMGLLIISMTAMCYVIGPSYAVGLWIA